MGKGIIRVSYDCLVQALGLPEGTEILQTQDHEQFWVSDRPTVLEVKLSHPDLPDVPEGLRIAFHDPQFRSERVRGEHDETRFLGWDDTQRAEQEEADGGA